MGVNREDELFRLMEKTPIYFEKAEDYHWFLSYVRDNHRHTYWFPKANTWEYWECNCCIGVNRVNHQICSQCRPRHGSVLTFDEALMFLEEDMVSVCEVADLL